MAEITVADVDPDDYSLLTFDETVEQVGISRDLLRKWIVRHDLPFILEGGTVFLPERPVVELDVRLRHAGRGRRRGT